ncbi:MAG: hypothetical protein AB3N63_08720 [Puniceicoccaceae bacterium]
MTQARHVFHPVTSGWDRIHAWSEATAEPVFVWGSGSDRADGQFFGSVKKEFKDFLAATSDSELTIYHDGIGADVLGPLDPHPHKILFVHNWFPRWKKNFDWTIRSTGKVIVGHPNLAKEIRTHFGWIPERYIMTIPQPALSSTVSGDEERSAPKQRTGIWLHGKKWRRYGNRLRSVIDRWPEDAEMLEVIASGKGCPSWARRDNVTWSMDLPVDFALFRLYTWDSTLLLNDYSLDSPWLQRALELDCFPLIPEGEGVARTPCWHQDSAPQVYPWGEIDKAAGLIQEWRQNKDSLLPAFKEWRSALDGEAVSGDAFVMEWERVKSEFCSQKAPKLTKRKPAPFWYPVAWYERVARLRAGL